MLEIRELVVMLRSPKASVRYDACELLRVAPEITAEATEALEQALKDSDPAVVERATAALRLHQGDAGASSQPDIGHELLFLPDYIIPFLPAILLPLSAALVFFAVNGYSLSLGLFALLASFAEPFAYAGGFCSGLLLPAAFLLPWLVIVVTIRNRRGRRNALLAGLAVGVFSSLCLFMWMQARLAY